MHFFHMTILYLSPLFFFFLFCFQSIVFEVFILYSDIDVYTQRSLFLSIYFYVYMHLYVCVYGHTKFMHIHM